MAPPADSSDESDFQGDIPFKKEEVDDDSASDGQSESGNNEDEYIVEQILGHEWKDNKLYLIVKWKGYEDPEDHTLEPEENLDNAKIAVRDYFKKIGGRPTKSEKKRKSRASTSTAEKKATPEPAGAKKKAKQSTSRASTVGASAASNVPDWVPKSNNWESHVASIDTIMRDPDDPTGPLFVYLNWNNGNRSRVSIQQANHKCPQKMLQFYEQHIVFKENPENEEP